MAKKMVFWIVLFIALGTFSRVALADVGSCVECSGLMDGACLAEKYLPFNQFNTDSSSEREWSAFEGNFFAKDNMIGVRFRLDDESKRTLNQGGLGLEVEIIEKGGHKLNWGLLIHNLPSNARITDDTRALDNGGDTVNAVLIRNPEKLSVGKDYYIWFIFRDSIPKEGVTIQPNIVIDIHTSCSDFDFICLDVNDPEACEYFEMETDSFRPFVAYPDSREGVIWNNKKSSEKYTPNLQEVNGFWYVSYNMNPSNLGGIYYIATKDESGAVVSAYNPQSSEDSETDPGTSSGDYGKVTMSTPSSSSSKSELYVKELKFKDEKTKYYDDETGHAYATAKNVGIDAPDTDIKIKLFRFKGETENGDTKEVGSENIRGTNLKSGDSKEEGFSFGAPDDTRKFDVSVDIFLH